MRKCTLYRVPGLIFFIFFSVNLFAQSGINTGINGMVINLPCNQNCITDPFQIPHIKSTSDYTVTTIPYNPYAFTSATGAEDPNLYNDDKYSVVINLPFQFCFYDSIFGKAVVGSNGLLTFDESNGGPCDNAFVINQPIPFAAGIQCDAGLSNAYYPKASIMGAYSDLNPNVGDSPADRKIQWWTEGTAPFRRFIVSFFHIGVFANTCGLTTPNTFQMVMYESTGIIEVYFEQKACTPSPVGSNTGNAILGIQNWARNKAVAAPGKNNTMWSETNTAYRFIPSGGASRFVSSEILTLTGNFIANADTATTTTGLLDLSFPGFCPSGTSDQYIIRTTYAACDNGAPLMVDDTITINKTNSLNATAAVTPTSCAPTGTGTATIDIPAGIGTTPYTYVLNPGGISQTGNNMFSGLLAGNYNIMVTDASGGCSSTVPVTIVNTGTLNVTYTVTNTSCVGAANGSIAVDPPVGTPPITYSINNGPFGSNNIFSNLAPGNYQIKVKDNGGCQATLSAVAVAAGAPITMMTSTVPTSCPGANNGSITVTGSSGTGPFQYSINGGNYQTNPTFGGLSPGTYFLSMKDAIGCTVTFQQATVVQGTSTLSGTATATNTSCSGANNGSITVTPASGSGPYEYTINNGTNWQTSATFSGLAAGNYTVKIREGGVCTSGNISVTVNAGTVLTGTATPSPTACIGVNNGSIKIAADPGFTGPFEYALDGGVFQVSDNFTGVAAGNHSAVIRNAAGCVSQGIPVTVPAGTVLTGNVSAANTSCSGAADGTVVITPTSGSPPYQYSLDGGPNQSNSMFTGVAAGSHTAVIIDNFGCISNPLPVNINSGTVLTGTAIPSPTACIGVNNGSIKVTSDPGFTGPFEYALDGGAFQVSDNFTGIAAGPHNAVIRNFAGCTSGNIAVTVSAGTSLNGTAVPTPVSCNGIADGIITITPGNGSAPYQYSLDGGINQSGNIFTNLAAGSHSVTITDAFGCISAPMPVTITQPAALTASPPVITKVLCNGANNGSITVSPAGGNSPYTYSLDNSNFQPSNVFSVAQGSYTVYVKDSKGCAIQFNNINVTEPPILAAAIVSTTNASCNGGSDGVIKVTANGGTSPYQYSIDGTTFQSSDVFNVPAGTYPVTIKDANNCRLDLSPVVIGLTDNLMLSTTVPAPICEGSSVQLQANGNAANYTWSGGVSGDLSSTIVPDPVASPGISTTYTVTAVLGSCSKTEQVAVNVIPSPVPDAGAAGNICFGQDYQLQASGGAKYTWNPTTYLDDAAIANPRVIRPEKTITYTLSVKDANDCPSLTTDQVTVTVTPPIQVFTSPVDTIVYAGDQFGMLATIPGSDTSYTWSPSIGLNDPNISTPTVTALNVGDVMTYKVIVTTSAGCQGEAYVTVKVYDGPDLYVANAFTPNHDGKNDAFIPFPVGIKQLNYFRVFNRWGQQLYFTKTLNQGWDGTMNGVEQGSGVYIWMAEAVTENGAIIKKKGTVTLIR